MTLEIEAGSRRWVKRRRALPADRPRVAHRGEDRPGAGLEKDDGAAPAPEGLEGESGEVEIDGEAQPARCERRPRHARPGEARTAGRQRPRRALRRRRGVSSRTGAAGADRRRRPGSAVPRRPASRRAPPGGPGPGPVPRRPGRRGPRRAGGRPPGTGGEPDSRRRGAGPRSRPPARGPPPPRRAVPGGAPPA